MQVPAMEPERRLLGRLPHVAHFAFPGAGVFAGVGSQPPALAHFVGHFLGYNFGGPSVTPPAAAASPRICQQLGLVVGSEVFNIALIASWPSSVVMFQVNETRSRQ